MPQLSLHAGGDLYVGYGEGVCKKLIEAVLRIGDALNSINRNFGRFIMAVSPAVEAIAGWGTNWRDVALAERAAKEAAVAAAETSLADATAAREALAAFQADDAATDASQLLAAAEQAENDARTRLDELKAGDPTTDDGGNPVPDPAPEPPSETGEPVEPTP